jgi:ArsR family transcriptional regulator
MHVADVPAEVLFQALADPTRIRVLRVLASTRGEACLCELVDSLQEAQYKLSRHLKLLRQAGVLAAEKDGRFVYHQLVIRHAYLRSLYAALRGLPDSGGTFAADLRRFKERMRLREFGRCRIGIQTPALAGPQPKSHAPRTVWPPRFRKQSQARNFRRS